MAVDTTVQVTLPQMGDSVTEGTILEWHKQEGDAVEADETLVEISTDKVDAEVPAPVSGHRRRRSTPPRATPSQVGTVLAEIATDNGAAPRRAGNGGARRRRGDAGSDAPAEAEPDAAARRDRSTSSCPTGASRSPRARSSSGHVSRGDTVADDETIVEISTDKVDAEVPAPAAGTITEILADEGDDRHRRPGHRADDDGRRTAPPQRRRRRRRRRRTSPPTARRTAHRAAAPADAKVSPVAARVAAAEGVDLARVTRHRPGRAHHQGRRARDRPTAAAAAPRRPRRRPPTGATAAARRRGDARPLHGREPLDPDRDLVPHDHRHDARRPPQAAQGRRPAGLLHPPDRLRDRARRRATTCR